jgi:ABC-type nickel/cobalt efflux system permease component RcnA
MRDAATAIAALCLAALMGAVVAGFALVVCFGYGLTTKLRKI